MCRIQEIILRSDFDEKFGTTSGSNVPPSPLFKPFQYAWPNINTRHFK